jgi:3-dehydroquinate dehydratase-2
MKILVIHGPNLNLLGKRKEGIYGKETLEKINSMLQQQAKELGIEIVSFQSNSEGALLDFIQAESLEDEGIIINPGALTHYGLSLRDALEDTNLPVIEVHISNIYAREKWRHNSVIAPIARGQISGLGWWGYIAALRTMVSESRGETF